MPTDKTNYWEFAHGEKGKVKLKGSPTEVTPEDLLREAQNYMNWLTANPIIEQRPYVSQGTIVWANVPKKRIASERGFCLYLGAASGFMKRLEGLSIFKEVVEYIRDVFNQDTMEGGAAGMLNPQISMRVLGLHDETKHILELTADDRTHKVLDTLGKAMLGGHKKELPPAAEDIDFEVMED